MLDSIVIGAGMAGLTAARRLAASELGCLVVEGRDRIGGRVHSVRDFAGTPVEAGAEFVHGSGARTWPDIEAAGLETRPCPLVRNTMFNIGHGTKWLPWTLMHPSVWPTFPILGQLRRFQAPDISARKFLDQRGYKGRARTFAKMTLTAHLPGHIDEIGVMGLAADGVLTLETGLNHRLDQGYDSLPAYIARGLDIRLGFTVEHVEWSPEGVRLRSTEGEELEARSAVVTLPVGVLRSGQVRFEPQLPTDKRLALSAIVMGPVGKVLLKFSEPFWPTWAANICCGTGPFTLYWPVFYGSGQDTEAVLIAYATGPRATLLSGMSEDRVAGAATADLERLFPGSSAAAKLTGHRRIDWTTDPYSRGGYTFLVPSGVGARQALAAPDTGPLFWAGSATEMAPIAATVEAAYSSGLRAAGEVERLLG
jgi:monoamine oxidase